MNLTSNSLSFWLTTRRRELTGNGPNCRKAALSTCRAARRLAQVASPRPSRARVSESPPRGARLVNSAPQWRRSLVEGGSTYVVVGETW